ncbi:MAG TPA: hypothetical protein VGF88_00410 [Acidobacteriaceae bacterium]|jgi:hypothetical protein
MRRAFAIALVLAFSLPLIAPALASGPDESQLPACCRRDGKHHCALTVEVGNIPSGAHVVSSKCPYSPCPATPLLQPHLFAGVSLPAVAGPTAGTAAVIRAAEAGYRISADRARHKRGPPELLAL